MHFRTLYWLYGSTRKIFIKISRSHIIENIQDVPQQTTSRYIDISKNGRWKILKIWQYLPAYTKVYGDNLSKMQLPVIPENVT
jgi:hypothetical protein